MASNGVVSDTFGILFAPDAWSPSRRFQAFLGPPFPVNRRLSQAISAVENRRQKLSVLGELANTLRSGLLDDLRELEAKGYTPARGSRLFTAVAETLFLELYSMLDAARAVLFESYPRVRGVQNKSTNKLFRRAHEHSYGPEFPEPIRQALAAAFEGWFQELRKIRVELSHGDIGSSHLAEESGPITYLHGGLGTPQRALVIDDLEARINGYAAETASLVDGVFEFLCSQLQPQPVRVFCGMFRGRLYERTVEYAARLTFDSGTCFSRRWFESEPEFLCPMRDRCGAYQRSSETPPSPDTQGDPL